MKQTLSQLSLDKGLLLKSDSPFFLSSQMMQNLGVDGLDKRLKKVKTYCICSVQGTNESASCVDMLRVVYIMDHEVVGG